MGTSLLDGNVLIALTIGDHVHHDVTARWFAARTDPFATCAITQGTLVRHVMRQGQPMRTAVDIVRALTAHQKHEFWPDDLSFTDVPTTGILGHRQVTDAYLAELARRRHGRVATLDSAMAAIHADVADLIQSE